MSLCLRDSVNDCKIVTMFYLFIYVYSLAYALSVYMCTYFQVGFMCICVYIHVQVKCQL